MKKCLFFVNNSKHDSIDVFERTKNVLKKYRCEYEVYGEECDIDKSFDFALVIGGDGTFLKAAGICSRFDLPLVGINLGRMGFLTTVYAKNLEEYIIQIMQNNFSYEERMMIEIFDRNDISLGVALNDIAFKNSFGHGVGRFKVYINGSLLSEYYADGILISTPTGSTAYSLSVGGPIVNPECELMIVNPISSHSLNSRSIIINSNDVAKVEFNADSAFIGVDGQDISSSDNVFTIKKSRYKCCFIKFADNDFYKNVFEKIK